MTSRGHKGPLLPPEEVQDLRSKLPLSQQAEYDHLLKGYTVGTAEQCQTEMAALAQRFNTQEIAVVTVTYDFSSRLESYRLLMTP